MATAVQIDQSLPAGVPHGHDSIFPADGATKKTDSTKTSNLTSAEQRFTTHTPPASDESHNGDDAASHQNPTHSDTAKDVDDGSSELSELEFENEENQDTIMEGVESTAPESDPKDDVYANIQPAEWSGKIPVFKPVSLVLPSPPFGGAQCMRKIQRSNADLLRT